jgi:hypothetical protein
MKLSRQLIAALQPSNMKHTNPITALIIVLFGLMLWQMHLQHWGSFLLLVAAEAALIAVRSTGTAKSKRL